jgi:hypothetical protein
VGDAAYAVEVNESAIWATRMGVTWWNEWRLHQERTGRITVITPSVGGDLVRVACDSKEDAAWLCSHMTGFAGIAERAVRVRRLAVVIDRG